MRISNTGSINCKINFVKIFKTLKIVKLIYYRGEPMIENEMIDKLLKNFLTLKRPVNTISSLVTSEIQLEHFFEDANKYLNFTYQFHYIFERWESI